MKINFVGRQITRSLAALCLGGAALMGSVAAYATPTFTDVSGFAGESVTLRLTEVGQEFSTASDWLGGITFQITYPAQLTLNSIVLPDDLDAIVFPDPESDGVSTGDYVSIALSGSSTDGSGNFILPSTQNPLVIDFGFLIDANAPTSSYKVSLACTDIQIEVDNVDVRCKPEDYWPTADGYIEVLAGQGGTVPEPASLALLAGGLLGLAAVTRRRQRKL